MDTLLFFGGLALIMIAWTAYLAAIPPEKVPERPIFHSIVMGLGLVAMLIGFVMPLFSGDGIPIGSIVALILVGGFGLLYFYLLSISQLPDGMLKVAVGDPLIGFEAADSTREVINTADWQGKRILLKFFRGRW